MDEIKQAFQKVKEDIFTLGSELSQIKMEILELKTELKLISSFLEDWKKQEFMTSIPLIYTPTHQQEKPTIPIDIPTHLGIPTDSLPSQALESQISKVSIGNEGVPTDRQTDRQTDQHIIQHIKYEEKPIEKPAENNLDKASEILASLDSLKKEVRLKFKRLTSQEMQVFSLLYSLEDQGEIADYRALSSRLNLTESSIRDYIRKIQAKGIPIEKEKLNNKRIVLHISPDLKKIASLNTILKLREL